ncbi:hypothetical protein SAY86_015977 [Trapa natans]|uniref:Sugar phosphate transporter domain-containing protein n=1 Tax=Trapa natans TaxID=22666 RepID=A0AAN7LBF3_TRANT|nr:hypothetical protein SAY86_015977 [Trapa natans]
MFGVWYLLNIYFNIYNKQVLKVYPFPATVTAFQFACGTVIILLMWTFNLHRRPKITRSQLAAILPLAIAHTMGNLLTNISLGKVAVSFTHTIKAMEPFFTVVLASLFIGEKPSFWVVSSLVPIVGGVALASFTEASFNCHSDGRNQVQPFLPAVSYRLYTVTSIRYCAIFDIFVCECECWKARTLTANNNVHRYDFFSRLMTSQSPPNFDHQPARNNKVMMMMMKTMMGSSHLELKKHATLMVKVAAVLLIILFANAATCYARQGSRHWRHRRSGGRKSVGLTTGKIHGRGSHHHNPPPVATPAREPPTPTPGPVIPAPPPSPSGHKNSTVFNVLDFGAKADGTSDDSKQAFLAAWSAACQQGASTVLVPSGSDFLLGPISFSGPDCKPHIVFQLEGKIIAPTSSVAWGLGLLQWIQFKKLNRITISGSGTIEGQGSVWWNNEPLDLKLSRMPITKPTSLRFYGSDQVTVTGITIQNSPQTHLKFDSCTNVQVFGISTSSPGNSPNTDGIHLQNSKDVLIHDVDLACGSGSVHDVVFLNIQVTEVQRPIVIDQYYCDHASCKNQTSAVAVSGVTYSDVRGTYTVQPVRFACSDDIPCTDITLSGIQLKPVQSSRHLYDPLCWEVYGQLETDTVPPLDGCLNQGNPDRSAWPKTLSC